MDVYERRQEIMKILYQRNGETLTNLATEFGVSPKTIRRDIDAITRAMPIYIEKGRAGGVRFSEGSKIKRPYITDAQKEVLQRFEQAFQTQDFGCISSKDYEVMDQIIKFLCF